MATTVRISSKEKAAWLKAVGTLLAEVEQWANAERWLLDKHPKTITEEALGTYELPELTIRVPGGNIIVEPIARDVVGADGRVDILSFPAMNRMFLTRKGETWQIRTDGGVAWPRPWGKAAFLELAKLLVSME